MQTEEVYIETQLESIMKRYLQDKKNCGSIYHSRRYVLVESKNVSSYLNDIKTELYNEINLYSEKQIKDKFKKIRTYSPKIIYIDLMNWYKEYLEDTTGIPIKDIPSPTKLSIEQIKEFMVYILLVEVVYDDYVERIKTMFGGFT